MNETLDATSVDKIITPLKLQDIFSKETANYKDEIDSFNKKRFTDQIFNFRESIKGNLVVLLYFEIALLSATLIFQGFRLGGFNLNDWAFGFFVNGCLIQTFFLIKYIVKHLFPDSN